MRSIMKVTVFVLILLVLQVPVAIYASNGPCPDDPVASASCVQETPPYYVVINRSVEYLYPDRPGSGCQPIILKHPECLDCTSAECAAIDVETEVCQYLPPPAPGDTDIVYEMCCNCATDPAGVWLFRIRELQPDGSCPITQPAEGWLQGLPPGTGVDLPAPVIIGGLVALGLALIAVGVLVRRRSLRPA